MVEVYMIKNTKTGKFWGKKYGNMNWTDVPKLYNKSGPCRNAYGARYEHYDYRQKKKVVSDDWKDAVILCADWPSWDTLPWVQVPYKKEKDIIL